MATSIAAQLETIKSLVQGESQPLKRPFTRPSILFDPKEAADIDVDTILAIALQGQLISLYFFQSRSEAILEKFIWERLKFWKHFVWGSFSFEEENGSEVFQ
jgi:hypothetical protein